MYFNFNNDTMTIIPVWVESAKEFKPCARIFNISGSNITVPDRPDSIDYHSNTGRTVAQALIRVSRGVYIRLAIPARSGEEAEHGWFEFINYLTKQ